MRMSSAGSVRAKSRSKPPAGDVPHQLEADGGPPAKDAPKSNPNKLRKKARALRELKPTGDAVSAFDDFYPAILD